MNFHFTTTKAHITRLGGEVLELIQKKGLQPEVLRFFFRRLKEIGHWQEDLVEKFRMDFGDSL